MPNNTKIQMHFVFVTKYRKKILDEEKSKFIKDILEEFIPSIKIDLISMEIEDENHIHMLLGLKPTHSVSKVVQLIKEKTRYNVWQKWPELRKEYWYHDYLWSSGYFCETVGEKSIDKVKEYIEKNS